jgi:hypothetical protein
VPQLAFSLQSIKPSQQSNPRRIAGRPIDVEDDAFVSNGARFRLFFV